MRIYIVMRDFFYCRIHKNTRRSQTHNQFENYKHEMIYFRSPNSIPFRTFNGTYFYEPYLVRAAGMPNAQLVSRFMAILVWYIVYGQVDDHEKTLQYMYAHLN